MITATVSRKMFDLPSVPVFSCTSGRMHWVTWMLWALAAVPVCFGPAYGPMLWGAPYSPTLGFLGLILWCGALWAHEHFFPQDWCRVEADFEKLTLDSSGSWFRWSVEWWRIDSFELRPTFWGRLLTNGRTSDIVIHYDGQSAVTVPSVAQARRVIENWRGYHAPVRALAEEASALPG